MPGMYPGGAVYNDFLHKFMDLSVEELQAILDGWYQRPWWRKVLGHCNPLVDWELKLKAAGDLIEAQEKPQSDLGMRVHRKVFGWRAEKKRSLFA